MISRLIISVASDIVKRPFLLLDHDSAKLAARDALTALDALGLVDYVGVLDRAGDRIDGALACAERAALALLGLNDVADELRALAGGALLVLDVGHVFVHEVLQGRLDGVGRRLAEAAERSLAHRVGDRLELLDVVFDTATVGNLIKIVEKLTTADTAGRALAAALIDREVEVELGDIDHAVGLVHNDQAAGTHDRADLGEVLVVDRSVEELGRNDTARRTARLSGLELVTAADTAADIKDDFAERRTHRNFDKTGVVDLTGKSEDLSTLRSLGTDLAEPLGALVDDDGDISERFDVVNDRRAAPKTLDRRERRTGLRHTAVTLDRLEKSRLFAADERAGAEAKLNVEVKVAAENLLAQKTEVASLLDGDLKALDGERIFRADVNVALRSADGKAGDRHGFENGVGIAFERGAVHVGAGVALVGVTDHVLLALGLLHGELPLHTGGEAGAAAAAETRLEHLVDDLLGRHLEENLLESLIAVAGDVVIDLLGIDNAAVPQNDAVLLLIEGNIGVGDELLGLIGIVTETRDDTALNEVLGDDFLNVLGLDLNVERTLRKNLDERTLFAETETSGNDYLNLLGETGGLEFLLEHFDDAVTAARHARGAAANQNV